MTKNSFIIPGLIFIAFCALYLGLSLANQSGLFLMPIWDIEHYMHIAQSGYEVYPCIEGVHFPRGEICGNPGWFPGWPLVVRILSFGDPAEGIIILPYIFAFLGFVLFYKFILDDKGWKKATIGLLALAAGPTAFYFLTGFPYALMLFLFGAYLYCLYKTNFKYRTPLLVVIAVFYSFTYPTACLLAIVPLIYLIKKWRATKGQRTSGKILKDILIYIVPFAVGPFLLSLYFWIKFDDFMLFLHFQEKYGRTWRIPIGLIIDSLRYFSFNRFAYLQSEHYISWAANFVLIWYGLVFILFPPYRIKSELIALAVLLYLFPPTTGALLSIWRHYVLIFPAAMIIAASPRPFWLKGLYIATGLVISLYIYFPHYLRGILI